MRSWLQVRDQPGESEHPSAQALGPCSAGPSAALTRWPSSHVPRQTCKDTGPQALPWLAFASLQVTPTLRASSKGDRSSCLLGAALAGWTGALCCTQLVASVPPHTPAPGCFRCEPSWPVDYRRADPLS